MLRNTPSNWIGTAVLALAIVCAVPLAASGQEQQGFAKIGGYAGGSFVPAFTLDGDTFDGFTYYREIDGDEIALLPKLDRQKMFKGILGSDIKRPRSNSATNAPATTGRSAKSQPVRRPFSS